MNVWGKKERSWRKARKRGVSPIIATILLVAITVVLAAVLYVLITGLTSGPGNAPLGSHFAWGTPTNASASTAYNYSIEIASVSGVSSSNIQLGLRNANGAATAFSGASIELWSAQGSPLASYSTTSNHWSSSISLSAGMSVTIGAQPLSGDSLAAIGVSSYSGTVVSSAFP